MTITIYHNPACGTSRNTLALLEHHGLAPRVIEYLKAPPSRAEILDFVALSGLPLRSFLREKGTPFHDLGLGDETLTDEALLDAIAAHPILLNRPVVVTDTAAALCRPSEKVLDLLPGVALRPFTKEDGEVIIDQDGQRVAK